MIPLQMKFSNWLVKVLSVSVAEFAVMRVGLENKYFDWADGIQHRPLCFSQRDCQAQQRVIQ